MGVSEDFYDPVLRRCLTEKPQKVANVLGQALVQPPAWGTGCWPGGCAPWRRPGRSGWTRREHLRLLRGCGLSGLNRGPGTAAPSQGRFMGMRSSTSLRPPGKAPGGKELVHRAEQVALLVELVYNLEGGVHRLGKMSCIRMIPPSLAPGHHLPHHPVGVLIPPVLRVDGPQDDGAARPWPLHSRPACRRGAEQEVVVAQGGLEQGPGGLPPGRRSRSAQSGELDVVEGVDADLVPSSSIRRTTSPLFSIWAR